MKNLKKYYCFLKIYLYRILSRRLGISEEKLKELIPEWQTNIPFQNLGSQISISHLNSYQNTLLSKEESDVLKAIEININHSIPHANDVLKCPFGFVEKNGHVIRLALNYQNVSSITDKISRLKRA